MGFDFYYVRKNMKKKQDVNKSTDKDESNDEKKMELGFFFINL